MRPTAWFGGRDDRGSVRAAALGLATDWVWPAWLERQMDPTSAWFAGTVSANVAGRNWTAIGTLASQHRALVDPTGMVTPGPDGWSLDWWIGAEDRWHFPSRDHAVRQGLIDRCPVVETLMRIPGGDAAARAYAVVGGDELGDMAVMEVENRSPTPIAVGFALRPCNPAGLASIREIQVVDRSVMVNGRTALLLPRSPGAVAVHAFTDGDVAEVIVRGAGGNQGPVSCPAGLAQATVVFPLAHRATIRVVMPLGPAGLGRPATVPSADVAARAWVAQSRRGLRVVLPSGRTADAWDANRRYVLQEPPDLTGRSARDSATVVRAFDLLGFHAEAREALQYLTGHRRQAGASDAAAAIVHAVAAHWRLGRSREALDHMLPFIARAAGWLDRSRSSNGLVASVDAPPGFGPSTNLYWDSLWALRAAIDAAELLRGGGDDATALRCEKLASALRTALTGVLASESPIPAGPDRRFDAGAVGSLVAAEPLELVPADHPGVAATADGLASRFCDGVGVLQTFADGGLSPTATMQLALVELAAGNRRSLDRVRWLVEASGATFAWPAVVHPVLGSGLAGDGHDAIAAASFVILLRNLLVGEDGGGVSILRLLPDEWIGEGIEVHDAPTSSGRLSFAVRWHGPLPALLWELVPHPGVDRVTLRAPGLDPGWSTEELNGEELLGKAIQEYSP